MLVQTHICYYAQKEDTVPKGSINLVAATLEKGRDDKKEKKWYFGIQSKAGRNYQVSPVS
jgi:hypothetical protein